MQICRQSCSSANVGAGSGADDVGPAAYATRTDFNLRVRDARQRGAVRRLARPTAEGRFPVILARTPWQASGGWTGSGRALFASRGFVFVAMDVRGRGDSDGNGCPIADGADGYDAISGAPPRLVDGKVGTIGLVQRQDPVADGGPPAAASLGHDR
jgi:hypothetical protein